MDWDPPQYLKFALLRLRPAQDLLARIPLGAPGRVVDLGCGSGEATLHMAIRWPAAAVLGVDGSTAMLGRARCIQHCGLWPDVLMAEGELGAELEQCRDWMQGEPADWGEADPRWEHVEWRLADIAEWAPAPGEAPDLIFSNAALHWLPDHEALFPRLLGLLAPGGCLAVQMPQSWGLPSHRLMRETLAEGGVGGVPLGTPELRARMARRPVAEAEHYRALLAPHCRSLEVWETVYLQSLAGEDSVYEWVAGAGLRPILEGLEPVEQRRFVEVYRARLRHAYPAGADGRVPYPFERLFIVAIV